ncbi:MAG: hypothetical protein WDZ30_10530 [Cellvibrionaceae bacterium]
MQCADIKSQLEALQEGRPQPDAIAAHLQRCAGCREYAGDLRLQRLLRTMPLREPEADFDKRILTAALSTQSGTRSSATYSSTTTIGRSDVGWMAVAAGLVLAVLVGLQLQRAAVDPRGVATGPLQVQVNELEPVQVMLNSDRALQNVTLTVELPSHIALQGYADLQRLQWTSNLTIGGNKLVLPVQYREDVISQMNDSEIGNTEILIALEHEGRRKQFRVPLQRPFRSSATGPATYRI